MKSELLAAGMKVSADVKNLDGTLLMPAGCLLNERQIGILQAWGVAEIEVEATGLEDGTEDPLVRLSPAALAALMAETKERFWRPIENEPAFLTTFQLVLCRRARQMNGR